MTTSMPPLTISVTGHRDLRPEDVPVLEGLVRTIVAGVAENNPQTPLVVLSPLAEGADRLVARVAMSLGARLIVPLPLPRALYEQDFESETSRAEFRALIDAAESVFELPIVAGNTLQGIAEPGEQRNRQYAQVGAYVARRSHVFLALWDGVTNGAADKPGGTAEVVRFRLEGAPGHFDAAASPLPGRGAVHHLVTPRKGAPLPAGALTHRLLTPRDEPHGRHERPEDLSPVNRP
jgi:hypothetical protein